MYNKTSLFGKLIVGAFTGMLLFTGVQTAHVYANNNSDTEYTFNFEGYGSEEKNMMSQQHGWDVMALRVVMT